VAVGGGTSWRAGTGQGAGRGAAEAILRVVKNANVGRSSYRAYLAADLSQDVAFVTTVLGLTQAN